MPRIVETVKVLVIKKNVSASLHLALILRFPQNHDEYKYLVEFHKHCDPGIQTIQESCQHYRAQ
ncbi:hypothetical protein CHS0354_025035, partial [Potamilus streckersoni]